MAWIRINCPSYIGGFPDTKYAVWDTINSTEDERRLQAFLGFALTCYHTLEPYHITERGEFVLGCVCGWPKSEPEPFDPLQ